MKQLLTLAIVISVVSALGFFATLSIVQALSTGETVTFAVPLDKSPTFTLSADVIVTGRPATFVVASDCSDLVSAPLQRAILRHGNEGAVLVDIVVLSHPPLPAGTQLTGAIPDPHECSIDGQDYIWWVGTVK